MNAQPFDTLRELFAAAGRGLQPPEFYRRLLAALLTAAGARAATLWLRREEDLVRADHVEAAPDALARFGFPEQQQAEGLKRCVGEGKPQVFLAGEPDGPPEARHTVAFVRVPGPAGPLGAVRLVCPPLEPERLPALLALADGFLAAALLYETLRAAARGRLERAALDRLGVGSVALHSSALSPRFDETVVNTAAEIVPAQRVALLAPARKGAIRLRAVSAVERPGVRSAWSRALTALADAAAATLERPLRYLPDQTPAAGLPEPLRDPLVSYAQLAECSSLLVLPLRSQGTLVGVLVLERFEPEPLSEFHASVAAVYASHAAIALDNRALFRSLPLSGRAMRRRERRAAGRPRRSPARYARAVLIGVALGTLIAFFGVLKTPDVVTCQCLVAPGDAAVVVGRVGGEIREARVRLGSEVRAGQPLFVFDTERLRLARARLESEIRQLQRERRRLLAEAAQLEAAGREGGARLAEAEARAAEQAARESELALLDREIADATVRAPIDGVVLEPAEPQALAGRVVAPGDPLCRIAALHTVRIQLAVPEAELDRVRPGAPVLVWLESRLAEKRILGRVRRIHLRSSPWQNRNVFVAELDAPNPRGDIRPGMTGKARISVGRSTWLARFLRSLRRSLAWWWF